MIRLLRLFLSEFFDVRKLVAQIAQIVNDYSKRNHLAGFASFAFDPFEFVERFYSYSYVFCLRHNVLVFLILFFLRTNIVPIFHKVNRLCEKKSLFFHNLHTFFKFGVKKWVLSRVEKRQVARIYGP